MKTFINFMIILMILGQNCFDAVAQSKNSINRSKAKARVTQTATPSINEIINSFEIETRKLSAKCPIATNGLCVIESVSFRNKCMSMTFAYSDKIEEFNENAASMDFSDMDYHFKLMIAEMIKSNNISISTFSKTGISFKFTIKDNYANILWSKTITPNEYVTFYKQVAKKGEIPSKGNMFNLESFRRLVDSWNTAAPQDWGDGMILQSVSMVGADIYYNVTTPYSYVLTLKLMNTNDKEKIKSEFANDLYEMYTGFSTKDTSILNNMIKLGITINYRFYTVDSDIPYETFRLPTSYIKNVGAKK